jgi:hypothetical protein
MNNPTQIKLKRFQDAIRDKWKCGARHTGDIRCNLVPFAHDVGTVSVFTLPFPPPDKNQAAKQCFVWDSDDFRMGESEVVVVSDVQVLDDTDQLFMLAVWAWLTGSLVEDAEDHYVESERWPRNKLLELHKSLVEFGADRRPGRFFVRTRRDGKTAVRIFWNVLHELNGKKDHAHKSFALDRTAIERIEPPQPGASVYLLRDF